MPRDLADRLRLKGWSNRKMGFAWVGVVAGLCLLLAVDLWLGEPFRKIDVAILLIGSLAILNAVYNEARGSYNAKVRIVRRDGEPDTFRRQTTMLLWVGGCLVSIGLVLQVLGLWTVLGSRGRP